MGIPRIECSVGLVGERSKRDTINGNRRYML